MIIIIIYSKFILSNKQRSSKMEKILTGLQPTGCITLGNYIGAIKQMIKYQDKYDSYIFIADMHAITVPQDSKN